MLDNSNTKLRDALRELWNNYKDDDVDIKLTCLQVLEKSMKKVDQLGSGQLYAGYEIFNKAYTVLEICDDSCCAERNQVMILLTECRW